MTTWVVCDSDLGLCSGNIQSKKNNCKFTLTIHRANSKPAFKKKKINENENI